MQEINCAIASCIDLPAGRQAQLPRQLSKIIISPQDTHIINQAKRELPDPEAHSFYRIKMPVTYQGGNYWVKFVKNNFQGIEKWAFEEVEKHPGAFRYPKGLLD